MPDVKLMDIDADGVVTLGVDLQAPMLVGIDALFQRVILTILKTPGMDVQEPGSGGGLQTILFGNITSVEERQAEVADVVRRAHRDMLAAQNNTELPASERLRDLEILALEITDEGTLDLALRVTNELNQTSTKTIGVTR